MSLACSPRRHQLPPESSDGIAVDRHPPDIVRLARLSRLRTRTFQRQVGMAKVVQVGTNLEPIPPTLLAAMRLTDVAELGLRVHVTPPVGLTLRPGEHVDLIIRQSLRGGTFRRPDAR